MNGAAKDPTDQAGCIFSVDNESLYSSHGTRPGSSTFQISSGFFPSPFHSDHEFDSK
jgi:hypothetical protein